MTRAVEGIDRNSDIFTINAQTFKNDYPWNVLGRSIVYRSRLCNRPYTIVLGGHFSG